METSPKTKGSSTSTVEIKVSTQEEEILECERRLTEIEREKQALLEEIAELERLKEINKVKLSRRSFLGVLGLGGIAVVGGLAGKSYLKNKDAPEPLHKKDLPEKIKTITKTKNAHEGREDSKGEKEEIVEDEVEESRQIINNEQYEQIIKNPYLVSALYYSEQAIERMAPPHEHRLEEIIWNIYPFITKQFRKNYIEYLKNVVKKKEHEADKTTEIRQSLPLNNINPGKNLEENHLDAIDLFAREGSPVYSVSEGIVVLAENGWKKDNEMSTSSDRGGNTVIIFCPQDESFYRYAHLKRTKVLPGTILTNGKLIGSVGHTGINASKSGHGEHLHFEINIYDRTKGEMVACRVFELKRKLQALMEKL